MSSSPPFHLPLIFYSIVHFPVHQRNKIFHLYNNSVEDDEEDGESWRIISAERILIFMLVRLCDEITREQFWCFRFYWMRSNENVYKKNLISAQVISARFFSGMSWGWHGKMLNPINHDVERVKWLIFMDLLPLLFHFNSPLLICLPLYQRFRIRFLQIITLAWFCFSYNFFSALNLVTQYFRISSTLS